LIIDNLIIDYRQVAHWKSINQEAVLSAASRRVSAAAVLEASQVLIGRLGEQGDLELDALVRELALEVVPVTVDQLRIARDAGSSPAKDGTPPA
jgi:uncharacterized protein with PIN domain